MDEFERLDELRDAFLKEVTKRGPEAKPFSQAADSQALYNRIVKAIAVPEVEGGQSMRP